jgi:hypothetical protein
MKIRVKNKQSDLQQSFVRFMWIFCKLVEWFGGFILQRMLFILSYDFKMYEIQWIISAGAEM